MPTSSSTISISRAGAMQMVRSCGNGRCGVERGEIKRHARAARGRIFKEYASAMLVDDLLDNREAEAGALGLGRYGGVKSMRNHFVIEAWSLVGEHQHGLGSGRRQRDRETGIGKAGLC